MTMSLTGNASQATQVEQARAVAEVIAAVQAAQSRPRNEDDSISRFMRSCARPAFAEKAFWKFRRSGEMLTGPTIDFALEALRCWGNATSGTAELARGVGQSEMLAFAWDLETNTQRRNTFVNPHTGYVDTPKKNDAGDILPPRKMIAVRDIRENNQSAGSRVEREAILSVLPAWYVEMGVAACYQTLAGDSAEPLEDRRRKVILYMEKRHGVTRAMLEAKIGAPSDQWMDLDLAQLKVADNAIQRGESTVDIEFRPDAVGPRPSAESAKPPTTAADLAAPVDTPAVDSQQGDGPGESTDPVSTTTMPTKAELNALSAALTAAGLPGRAAADRDKRIRLCSILTGRTDLTTADQLNALDVENIAAALAAWGDNAQEEVALLLAEDADDRDRAAGELDAAVEASGDDA